MALIILIILALILVLCVALRFAEPIGNFTYKFILKPIINIFK